MEIKVGTRTLASFRFSLSQVSNPPLSFRLWIPLRASLDQAAARPLANGERADPTVLGLLKRVHGTITVPVTPASFSLSRHLSDAAPSAPKDPTNKFTYPPVYEPYGPSPPPSSKILDLADRIASLPPGEIKQIGPALFLHLNQPLPRTLSGQGLSLGSSQAAGPGKSEEKKKEEKTAFDVKLEKFDTASKIKVIKEVRSFTNLGLKEAKDLVEKVPIVVKQGVTKEEATEIMAKIKAAGGIAVME